MADGGAGAAVTGPTAPLFTFGLIADVQYSDIPDGESFDGSERRHYRGTLRHARAAAADFAARGAAVAIQIGDLVDGKTNQAATVGVPAAAEPCEASLAAYATALEALAGPYELLHVRGNQCVGGRRGGKRARARPSPSHTLYLSPPPSSTHQR
jgi:hypothetical protein